MTDAGIEILETGMPDRDRLTRVSASFHEHETEAVALPVLDRESGQPVRVVF